MYKQYTIHEFRIIIRLKKENKSPTFEKFTLKFKETMKKNKFAIQQTNKKVRDKILEISSKISHKSLFYFKT